MTTEQERSFNQLHEDREALVTKALLLGYTFVAIAGGRAKGPYVAITPDGKNLGDWYNTRWAAAISALHHAGVYPDGWRAEAQRASGADS